MNPERSLTSGSPSSSSSPRPTRSSMRQAMRSSRLTSPSVAAIDSRHTAVDCAEHDLAELNNESTRASAGAAAIGSTRDYSCLMCSSTFASAEEFEYHIEVHASLCPSLCLRCTRSFQDRRLLYRHLHFKHGVAKRHFRDADEDSEPQQPMNNVAVDGIDEDMTDNDNNGINRMKQGFLPETSDSWKLPPTNKQGRLGVLGGGGDVSTSNAALDCPPTTTTTTTTSNPSRKPVKRCQICDKVFQKITDLRRHVVASHSEVEPIECIPCNRFFATPRSFSIHQRMVHGFLDRTNRKRQKKVDGLAPTTSDGDENNTDGDEGIENCSGKSKGPDGELMTVVGPLENIVSEPDLELLNDVSPASQKHFPGGVHHSPLPSHSSTSKNVWADEGENEELVYCVATKKDESDRVTSSEAIKFRVNLQAEEVLVTRVLGTNVANGERSFLYKCHWCSEIVVSLDALLEHIAVHARNQQKTVMCYNCGQLFSAGERGVEELKEHLRVYHGTAERAHHMQQHHHHQRHHRQHQFELNSRRSEETSLNSSSSSTDNVVANSNKNNKNDNASNLPSRPREESVQMESTASSSSARDEDNKNKICDLDPGLSNGIQDPSASLNVKREQNGDDDDAVHVKMEPPEDNEDDDDDDDDDDDKHDVHEDESSPRHDDHVDPGSFFPEHRVKTENRDVDEDEMMDEEEVDGDEEEEEDFDRDAEGEEEGQLKDNNTTSLSPADVVPPSVVISEDGTRGYQCNVCQKLFERLFSLNRHLRGHTGFKPCYCRECGKGFSEPRNLRHHVIRFHSDGSLRHLLRRRRYGEDGRKLRSKASSVSYRSSSPTHLPDPPTHPDGLDLMDDSSPDATIYSELSADGAEFAGACQPSTSSKEIPENLMMIPQQQIQPQQHHQGPSSFQSASCNNNLWDHREHHQELPYKSEDGDDGFMDPQDVKCFPPHSAPSPPPLHSHLQPPSSIVRHLLNQVPAPQTSATSDSCNILNNSPDRENEDDVRENETSPSMMAAVDLSLLPGSRAHLHHDFIGAGGAALQSSSEPYSPSFRYPPSGTATPPTLEGSNECASDPTDEQLLNKQSDSLVRSDSKSRKTKRKSGLYLSRYLPRLDIVVSPVMRSKSSTKILPNGKTVFTCLYCRKVFATSSDLNRHMDFHEDLRPYKCEFCDYCSRTNSQLKVHMMRHQGIKQYPCEPCNYFAVTSSDLNRHKKSQGHLIRAGKKGSGEGVSSTAKTNNNADKTDVGGGAATTGGGDLLEESSCSIESGVRDGNVKQEADDYDNDDGEYHEDDAEENSDDLDLQDDNAVLDAAFSDICDRPGGEDELMAP